MISKLYYFIKYLSFNKKELKSEPNRENIILNEISDIKSFSIPSSYFCKALSELMNAKVISYNITLDLFRARYRHILNIINPFSSYYIYKSFSDKILYLFLYSNKYKKIFNNLNSKEDLLNLKYKNIEIGDLIYDDYLTRYKLPTIDIKSKKFTQYIKLVEQFILLWENYLLKNKVKAVVTSHSVYLMGLINRLAIIHNIPSYLVTPAITYRLNKKQFIRWSDQEKYPKQFKKLTLKQRYKLIKLSTKNLNNRLTGKKDFRYKMSNNIEPVFKKNTKINKIRYTNQKNKNILIASHCLSDAPHVYGRTLFTDFNDWLNYLGKVSQEKKFINYTWYIKPHPAFYKKEYNFYDRIIKKYKNFKLLEKHTTHNSIINDLKINYVLTVFGSIAHEYPLLNIPVINAGNNPHSGYDFSISPKSIYEYKKYLINLDQVSLKINKKKVYEFYGMHHLIDLPFFNDLKIYFNSPEDHQDFNIYVKFIRSINSKINKKKIDTYREFINDKSKRRLIHI